MLKWYLLVVIELLRCYYMGYGMIFVFVGGCILNRYIMCYNDCVWVCNGSFGMVCWYWFAVFSVV